MMWYIYFKYLYSSIYKSIKFDFIYLMVFIYPLFISNIQQNKISTQLNKARSIK